MAEYVTRQERALELLRQLDDELSLTLGRMEYRDLVKMADPDKFDQWENGLITCVELLIHVCSVIASEP